MCAYNILQCTSFHSSLWNDWFPHSCWFAPDMIQPFVQFSNFAFSTDKFHQPCIIAILPLLYFFTITQDVCPSLQLSLSTKSFQMSHDLHDGGSVPLMSLLSSLVSSSSVLPVLFALCSSKCCLLWSDRDESENISGRRIHFCQKTWHVSHEMVEKCLEFRLWLEV